jgi:hypothetical protein
MPSAAVLDTVGVRQPNYCGRCALKASPATARLTSGPEGKPSAFNLAKATSHPRETDRCCIYVRMRLTCIAHRPGISRTARRTVARRASEANCIDNPRLRVLMLRYLLAR